MSSQYLSRREVEDLRPSLDKAIYRCLGYSDSSLVSTASSCLTNGYDRRKTADKLSSILDSKKAARLAEKILQLADDALSSQNKSNSTGSSSSQVNSRKRSHRDSPQSGSTDGRHRSLHPSERSEGKRLKGDGNTDSVKAARGSDNLSEDSKGSRNSKGTKDETKRENGAPKDYGNSNDYGPEYPPDHSALPLDSVGAQMAVLSADRIRLMMVTAQKEIEERKRALIALKGEDAKAPTNPNVAAVSAARAAAAQIKVQILPNSNTSNSSSMPPPGVIKPVLYSQPTTTVSSREDYEKQKRMAELQAKIQSKLAGTRFDTATAGERPRPLILDTEGRAVDHTGRQVMMAQHLPTLKANIRAKKREELKAQLGSKSGPEQEEAAWFDSRVAAKPAIRTKRALRFHEPGRFQQMADRIRMKAQLEKLQNEISQIARKTGISSATKMALLAPDLEDADDIPELEWWDSVILMTEEEKDAATAKALAAGIIRDPDDIAADLKEDAISNLVEHPTQMRPPSEPTKPVYMPVFLTKRERKKLRRQTRREAWKEEQEKVRLGLEAPAEPKLRISNLMRVLGSEAVQDPTKIEAHVREQMAKRRKAHEEANAARRLTREQRGERRANRLKEDTTLGVHVGLYRVQDLFETASKKFKVEKNAQQLFMTGCVLLHRGCCVIITEGGPKQHSKFKRLMLHRIKWEEDKIKDQDGLEAPNSCQLIWEGTAANRSFGEIKFKVCPTERSAREHLAKYRVQHYWDLAYGSAVLGAPGDDN